MYVCVCLCVYVCRCILLNFNVHVLKRAQIDFFEYRTNVCYVLLCLSLSLPLSLSFSRSLFSFLTVVCLVSFFFFCKCIDLQAGWTQYVAQPRIRHWQLRAPRDAPRPFDDDNDHGNAPRLVDRRFYKVRWDEVIRGHRHPRCLHRYPETQSIGP